MSELEKLLGKIEETRTKLIQLLNKKENLLDPEVIAASKMLDSILNEYNDIISKKQHK